MKQETIKCVEIFLSPRSKGPGKNRCDRASKERSTSLSTCGRLGGSEEENGSKAEWVGE